MNEMLFDFDDISSSDASEVSSLSPLSTRMRPRSLDEYFGQGHLLERGKLLRRLIDSGRLTSMILYGPPGIGKTSLARLMATAVKAHFVEESGVRATAASLRQVFEQAKQVARLGRKMVLFLDEIHRLHKGQQDLLLPLLEEGPLILIGATTENPFFALIPPLLSRTQIFQLQPLTNLELIDLQEQALADQERGLGNLPIALSREAAEHLSVASDGDARKCLDALELAATTTPYDASGKIVISLEVAEESIQQKMIAYQSSGDQHYDVISAFIKSVRGSDPDAAIYWLATMLHAGEDPLFIARRLLILSSEDIGLADPQALVIASAAQQAVATLGMPEARIPLAEATIYLAQAPKSNSAYMAINKALEDVQQGRTLAVPTHLKDAHYQGAVRLGAGKGYLYPHDYPGGKVAQDYLPEKRGYYVSAERDLRKSLH